jgi:hypothetical protein
MVTFDPATKLGDANRFTIRDVDGRPVGPQQAAAIIAEHWTVPAEVRARRRNKKVGKAPKRSQPDRANGATFPKLHRRPAATNASTHLNNEPLDIRSRIGNQTARSGAVMRARNRSYRAPTRCHPAVPDRREFRSRQ